MKEPPGPRPAERPGFLFADARRPAWILAIGCAVAWLPALSSHDLWAPNEPRYAQVAREMVERSDFLVPHLNGEVYPDKPPLFFWLEVGSATLLGFSEFAVRLPSALASIALVLLTYRLGLRLFGARAGFFAGASLATSRLVFEQATRAVMDPLLALCVAGALAVYLEARWTSSAPRAAAVGFLSGLGVLTKLVGFLAPLVAVVEWFARRRRKPPLLAPLVCLLALAAVVAAWFVPATFGRPPGEGLSWGESVGRQSVGRLTNPWNHENPPWYFLVHFPLHFLPWTPFLLLAIPLLRKPEERDRDGVRFALAWFATIFVFFSVAPGKRAIYLYPAFPAAALLTGLAVARVCEGRAFATPWAKACAATGPALVALGAAGMVAAPFVASAHPEVGLAPPLLAGALIALAGLPVAAAHRRGGFRAFFPALAASTAAAGLLISWLVLPRLDGLKSAAPLARALVALRHDEPVVFWKVPAEGFRFYSELPIRDLDRERLEDREEAFLAALAGVPPAIGVTTEESLRRVESRFPPGVVRLSADLVGHRGVVVVGRPRAPR